MRKSIKYDSKATKKSKKAQLNDKFIETKNEVNDNDENLNE